MTIKVWLLFLLLVLPLAFCYYDPSLSHELSPRSEFKQCRQSCQVEERSRPQMQFCEQRCEDVLREREREEERDRPETYGRCEQRCERQATGQQQQLCWKRCEEHRRGRNNVRDPEEKFQQCQQRCQRKEHEQGQGQQQQCQRQCRERYEEEQGQEGEDPRQRFEKCQEKCQRQEYDKRQQQCQKQCRERYEQEQEREHHRQGGTEWGQDKPQREREEESEQSHRNNPYYFHSRRFQSKFRSEQGHLSVLERFTERSQLLRGIENYRMAMIVARPRTFVLPNHCDGDSVLVVIRGNGTISLVRENKRESYNIEFGDAMALQAGTTVYLVNNNENENMEIVKLVQPVNNPGNFQEFFAGGTENPQSYYSAFSSNLLEQVLGVSRDQIERVFGGQQSGERQRGERQHQQQEGFIRRASQEQLKALSKHASSSKRKGGRNSNGPISLKNQKPLYSNNNGKFFEANPQEFKQLQDMDVFVNLVDINQGSIMVPHYNSKATVMAIVVEGNGRFEMACPHMSSQRQQGGGEPEEEEMEQYENVGARISPGDVFIIPAGHPVAIVSSQNQNLRIVGFGVNAQNSQRNFLAGKDNLMNQVETEAKELAFNVAGKEADGIFNNQKQSHFVPQQGQREESSRSHPLISILDFGEILRA